MTNNSNLPQSDGMQAWTDAYHARRKAAKARLKKHRAQKGWIYVARSNEGFLKIGFSKNPRARVSTLSCDWTLMPGREYPIYRERHQKLKITPLLAKPGVRNDEIQLHGSLLPYRASGCNEWYREDQDLVRLLEQSGFRPFCELFPLLRRGRKPAWIKTPAAS